MTGGPRDSKTQVKSGGAGGSRTALALADEFAAEPALCRAPRLWAIRADLRRSLGADTAALGDYDRALQLVRNDAERRYLVSARDRLGHAPQEH